MQALSGVSFDVPAGSVFGVLGPNGSGKTTLLGIVTDVLKADTGSFTLFDKAPSAAERRQIGTLLETPNFYHYLSAYKNLEISAAIKQRGKDDIARVLEICGLTQRQHSAFKTYSLGMKQRLAIAAVLLGDPDVLILDEPTNGLDPSGIAEVRELVRKLADSGKTIILASHLLDEVEKVCTHVAILRSGQLLLSGPVHTVISRNDFVELSAADNTQLQAAMLRYPGCTGAEIQGNIVRAFFAESPDAAAINSYCAQQGIWLSYLQLRKKSLETAFLEITNIAAS
ncbi:MULTISPECIES: ABC transporter ATP-binding protein [Chitinophaga]|uniref:ABC transporter ATP-binding protein n=1 Tax=Chitinophaga TaxID=79328 RepID=UPI000DC02630|nr:ATP-binding cassette domain-containing protein [Chitinophaga ginsengisegetis]MDR6565393.1 ABC-2 type transport system ATP-binding protein [Chitinophaga ginsengisegetis]MDR6645121.1 ABC-2 type transport system ATP-binding protein [Chitinophaga ginsengisegetis]MDR6652287.1 ABC-2 type transport system ATP-binding protein [Chitinophaga ginsengisegetis]